MSDDDLLALAMGRDAVGHALGERLRQALAELDRETWADLDPPESRRVDRVPLFGVRIRRTAEQLALDASQRRVESLVARHRPTFLVLDEAAALRAPVDPLAVVREVAARHLPDDPNATIDRSVPRWSVWPAFAEWTARP